jgi:diguanylate cyclase (GGDEF)-like protein
MGSINVRQLDTGTPLLHGIFLDITQRKRNDEELDRYRERLEEMVEERTKTINEYASRLEKLTTEDALTGITNRRYFDREYEKEWRRTARRQEPLGVLMIDVDDFKKYNDHYGHGAGDKCLRTVAGIIQKQLRRAGDFVSRYGGEEFIAVVPGADEKACVMLAARIRSALEVERITHHASTVAPYVTLSIGVCSVYPNPSVDANSVVANADKALYQAKKEGRNRSVLFINRFDDKKPLASNG